MADFSKSTPADMAAGHPGINMGTSGSMREVDWGTEDAYWQSAYPGRPYARADRGFDYYRSAYRYGSESAVRHHGRDWNDVETDLRRDWDSYRGESSSVWEDVKDAVRDAWDRVRGQSNDDRTHIR